MKLDQDSKQRLQTALSFFLEATKVTMGSFLVVFVPRECTRDLCTFHDNIIDGGAAHVVGLCFNGLSFLAFFLLYTLELRRENFFIEFFDVDESKTNDNLDSEIEFYPNMKQRASRLNANYRQIALLTTFIYALNVSVSMIDLSNHFSTDAVAPLVSYVILIGQKLLGSTRLAKQALQEEKMLSAYMKTPTVFNTIDADYRSKTEQKSSAAEAGSAV